PDGEARPYQDKDFRAIAACHRPCRLAELQVDRGSDPALTTACGGIPPVAQIVEVSPCSTTTRPSCSPPLRGAAHVTPQWRVIGPIRRHATTAADWQNLFIRRRSMSPVVDSHQHFWTYGTYQTSWMEAPPYAGDPVFQPLRRSF